MRSSNKRRVCNERIIFIKVHLLQPLLASKQSELRLDVGNYAGALPSPVRLVLLAS